MKEKVKPFVLIYGSSIKSNRKEITIFWITIERDFELNDRVNNLCKKANGKRPCRFCKTYIIQAGFI